MSRFIQHSGALPTATAVAIAAAAVASALMFAAVFGASPALADGPGCDDGNSCVWDGTNFNGNKRIFNGNDCCNVIDLGSTFKSAKNRFGSRKFVLFNGSGSQVACLDPGENRQDPGNFSQVKVGDNGSNC
jgi:hypothetical protein